MKLFCKENVKTLYTRRLLIAKELNSEIASIAVERVRKNGLPRIEE